MSAAKFSGFFVTVHVLLVPRSWKSGVQLAHGYLLIYKKYPKTGSPPSPHPQDVNPTPHWELFQKKKKIVFSDYFFFSKNGNPCFQLLNPILIFKVYEKVFPLFPDTFFIWLTHEIFFSNWKKNLVDGWKKKVSEVTRKLKPFIFLVLKLLGATLGRLFFTFKCLNLRKIAFYSMFIKKKKHLVLQKS